jgi:hypothetical protein
MKANTTATIAVFHAFSISLGSLNAQIAANEEIIAVTYKSNAIYPATDDAGFTVSFLL